jgi:NADH dehydrogenase [ubiquinone] 1 alpha subcomplex assembly factor 5
MSEAPRIFDIAQLARLRARAAAAARDHDFLLQRVADDFSERLDGVQRRFATVLDLGSHHGVIGRRLATRAGTSPSHRLGQAQRDPTSTKAASPVGSREMLDPTYVPSLTENASHGTESAESATIVSLDPCPAMLTQCAEPKVLADPQALPFAESRFDLVVSGLALHLVNDLPGTLVQIRRCLKPDGLFLGAVLGGATLTELRQAFVAAEAEIDGGASPRVAPFADVRDLGSLLQRAGFALPVVDADVVTVAYATPLHLMRELRAMGASNMLAERRRVPLKRATLLRAAAIYSERFSRPDGRVTATFEIITMTGWCPHESQQKPLQPGSATTRLADALGVPERKA